MKKVLWNIKWRNAIGFLRFYLLGVFGAGLLVYLSDDLLQYLGLKPMVDEIKADEVVAISIVGSLMILLALCLFISCMLGMWQKNVKEFIEQLNENQKEKLVCDYNHAVSFGNPLKIGKLYTYTDCDGSSIIDNSKIIWVYYWCKESRYAREYYLSIHTLENEEVNYIKVRKNKCTSILQYYMDNFPNIVTEYNDETVYLYEEDIEGFLNLRYYREQNS